MPTYEYETIPDNQSVPARRFEVFQKMSDEVLKVEPETGLAVRRIISGGIGIKLKGLKRSTIVNKSSPAATRCGCSSGHHH